MIVVYNSIMEQMSTILPNFPKLLIKIRTYIFNMLIRHFQSKSIFRNVRITKNQSRYNKRKNLLYSGGFGSTYLLATSAQFVDNTVPPDSSKDLFMARRCSGVASA